jgi:hypothetical protein
LFGEGQVGVSTTYRQAAISFSFTDIYTFLLAGEDLNGRLHRFPIPKRHSSGSDLFFRKVTNVGLLLRVNDNDFADAVRLSLWDCFWHKILLELSSLLLALCARPTFVTVGMDMAAQIPSYFFFGKPMFRFSLWR